jgi:hypothetical protein
MYQILAIQSRKIVLSQYLNRNCNNLAGTHNRSRLQGRGATSYGPGGAANIGRDIAAKAE